jgi:hypothetical protein
MVTATAAAAEGATGDGKAIRGMLLVRVVEARLVPDIYSAFPVPPSSAVLPYAVIEFDQNECASEAGAFFSRGKFDFFAQLPATDLIQSGNIAPTCNSCCHPAIY